MKENKIYKGNCIDILKKIKEESIGVVITDPPYNYEFIGREWNDDEVKRRTERVQGKSTMIKNIPYGSGLSGGVRNARWYKRNQENNIEYTEWCKEWGKELYRVCKAGSPVAIFNSNRSIAHVQIAMESCGFYTRDIMIFRRNSGIPRGLNLSGKLKKEGHPDYKEWEGWHSALRNEWEAILLVQKPLSNNYWETIQKTNVGLFKTIESNGAFLSNIFEGYTRAKDEKFEHCTVKPLSLIEKLVDVLTPQSPENIVLDPFAGSGTTLVAAKKLGHPYIGIEIEKNYLPIIEERLKLVQPYLI